MAQDLAMQKMKIYSIRPGTSEDPDDVSIVIDGMKVLTAQGNFPRACSMLVGTDFCSEPCLSQGAYVYV